MLCFTFIQNKFRVKPGIFMADLLTTVVKMEAFVLFSMISTFSNQHTGSFDYQNTTENKIYGHKERF